MKQLKNVSYCLHITNLTKVFLYGMFFFIFSGCKYSPTVTINNIDNQKIIPLVNFQLQAYHVSEDAINSEELYSVIPDSTVEFESETDIVDLSEYTNKNVFVLSTYLKIEKNQQIFFLYGSKGKASVWIDGRKIHETGQEPLYKKYSYYLPLAMKEGRHELTIQAGFEKDQQEKKLVMAIGSNLYAQKRHHELFFRSFLERSILDKNDSLLLNLPHSDTPVSWCTISNNDGLPVKKTVTKDKVVLHDMGDGLYYSTLSQNDRTYKQAFVLGNEDSVFQTRENMLKSSLTDSCYRQFAQPAIDRYKYLSKHRKHTGQRIARFGISIAGEDLDFDPPRLYKSTATILKEGTIAVDKNCRFLQVTGYGNSFHSWNAISEVKIWGGDPDRNESNELVIGSIIASGYAGHHYPSCVTDHDLSTCWESEGEGETIRFDLQDVYRIDSIQIAWKADQGTLNEIASQERELVSCLEQMDCSLISIKNKKNVACNTGGRLFRAYFSPTDHLMKQYLVQAPETIDTSVLYPLVFHLLPRVQTPMPLNRSYLVSSDETERMQYEVIKRGTFIDVWSFLDNYNGIIFPSAKMHFLTLLNQLKNTYPVDTNRIYIMASCSGIVKTIQLASEVPVSALSSCPVYWDTTGLKRPVSLLYNTRDIPIQVIASEKDHLTPINGLRRFIQHMQEVHVKPVETIINKLSRDFYVADNMQNQLDFLLSQKMTLNHRKIAFKTSELKYGTKDWINITKIKNGTEAEITAEIDRNNSLIIETKNVISLAIDRNKLVKLDFSPTGIFINEKEYNMPEPGTKDFLTISLESNDSLLPQKNKDIEGPVSHFFAKPSAFTVIGKDKWHNDEVARQFDYYAFKNFVRKYKYTPDRELDEKFIRKNHVLLIKTDNSSNLSEEIISKIPIAVNANKILINNKSIPKQGKAFFTIYPNPLNPAKYILVLDVSGVGYISSEMVTGLMQSNFDYAVYDFHGLNAMEILHGNYNENWKLN